MPYTEKNRLPDGACSLFAARPQVYGFLFESDIAAYSDAGIEAELRYQPALAESCACTVEAVNVPAV